VVVPLVRKADWDTAKTFARAVSEVLVRRWPADYLATASKSKRRGKIFIDYLRNGRGATSVASYSTRARPGATVATPLAWEELTARLNPQQFDIFSVPKRLAALPADPWADFRHTRQSIGKVALAGAERLLR
jgi:bifunctional non-homologous end joining protein LigD